MFGGIVSGIWLAILGEWGTIGRGLLFFIISTFAISIILMPSMLLSAPAAYCAEKGKTFGMLCFGTLSNLYIVLVITAWCCGILFLFVRDAESSRLIPKLIWSYGVATGPWAYMASKEQGGAGLSSTLSTLLAEVAYVVIVILIIFSSVTFIQALMIFAGFMLVSLVTQMTLAYLIQKEMVASSVE